MLCVDDREEWKDGLHPLQIWFNVTDFLVSSLDTQDMDTFGTDDFDFWYNIIN